MKGFTLPIIASLSMAYGIANAQSFEIVSVQVEYDGGTSWPADEISIGPSTLDSAEYWTGSSVDPYNYHDTTYFASASITLPRGNGNLGTPFGVRLEREEISIVYTVKWVPDPSSEVEEDPPASITGVFDRRTRTYASGSITGSYSTILSYAATFYFDPYPPTLYQDEEVIQLPISEAGSGLTEWEESNPGSLAWFVYEPVTSASATGYSSGGNFLYDIVVPAPLGDDEEDISVHIHGECLGTQSQIVHAAANTSGFWQFRLVTAGGVSMAPAY